MTTPAEKVARWSRADRELFLEMAGKHLSDGVRPELADQLAYLELARLRREREAGDD